MKQNIKSIKILGKTYSVEYLPYGHRNLIKNDKVCGGRIKTDLQQIYIEKGLAEETNTGILLHECLHGLSNAMNIDLTENQALGLEEGLLALLKDNPKLTKMFLKKG